MKIAYKARDIVEAHIVAGMLQSRGLDAHVGGHFLQGAVGDMAPLDFAVVWVADNDAEAARDCIAEYDAGRGQEAPASATNGKLLPDPS